MSGSGFEAEGPGEAQNRCAVCSRTWRSRKGERVKHVVTGVLRGEKPGSVSERGRDCAQTRAREGFPKEVTAG